VVNQAHFEPGDFIVRQGDVGDQFYVIVSGQVEVFREMPDGQKVPLAQLRQGEYFGETSLLSGKRRNASVRALGPVDLMCIGREEFHTLAGAWLKFSESVQELSEEREKVVNVGWQGAGQSDDFGTILARSLLGPQLAGLVKSPDKAPAAPAPPPPPSLVRSDGAELQLEGDVLYLGRGPDNHIVVNDKLVSRRHSALKREGANYVLEDLGTTNGTHVNGQRIQRHVLAQGDVVRLGGTLFSYRVPG